MSTTVSLYPDASAYITKQYPDRNQHNINSLELDMMNGYYIDSFLLLRFPAISQEYKYRSYTSEFHIYARARGTILTPTWKFTLRKVESFNPDTVTYNTRPKEYLGYKYTKTKESGQWDTVSDFPDSITADQTYISACASGTDYVTVYGSASANYKPYIVLTFDDEDAYLEPSKLTPASGEILVGGTENKFNWTLTATKETPATISQTSAVLRWRHNSTETWNEINIPGDVPECTVPADTFPAGKIFWQVQITDETGHTETSETQYFFSTFKMRMQSAALVSKDTNSNRQYDALDLNLIKDINTWRLVGRFGDIPQEYLYKKLLRTFLRTTFQNSSGSGYRVWGIPYDVDTLTVVNGDLPTSHPNEGYGVLQIDTAGTVQKKEQVIPSNYSVSPAQSNTSLKNALASKSILSSHCLVLQAYSGHEFYVTDDMWLEIAVDDTETIISHVTQQNCPTSGWVSPGQDNTFAWTFENYSDYPSPGDWTQASGSFFWRLQGEETWNEIQASGSKQSVTVPAETFPGGTIQWYITATDSAGTTSSTPVYTITTNDSAATAIPMEPVSVPTTGNKPIDFRWVVSNDSGSIHTRSDLQTSTDGKTWTDFVTITGNDTTYTAPAYTFGIGTILWRVRAYNRDGVAGSWSDAVSFLNIMAPLPPVVTVQAVPFAVIMWQAVAQQAYRVTIDGTVYGPYFGVEKSFTLPDYLEDGPHNASVEIQGDYSLWSDAGETSFTIQNAPGKGLELTGESGIDEALKWTSADDAADFYIYRDGERIGHTTGLTFTDRFSLGMHEWHVINRLPDGNYVKSNSVTGAPRTENTVIAALDAIAVNWISLRLTERSQTQQAFGYTRTQALLHVTGAAWPVLELSPFESLTATFDAAFLTEEDARPFTSLWGKRVVLKTKGGDVIIGALTSLAKVSGEFYLTFEFTIQRIHWEEYIDDTNG